MQKYLLMTMKKMKKNSMLHMIAALSGVEEEQQQKN
jgi:hypothetical protein